jgi:hypothetical protein
MKRYVFLINAARRLLIKNKAVAVVCFFYNSQLPPFANTSIEKVINRAEGTG